MATNLERDPQLTNGHAHYRSFTRDCFCLATCVPAHDRARFLTYLARSRSPDVLLLVGSRLTYETLEALRAARPGLRVIDHLYNTERPHQGLPGRVTPLTTWEATAKAEPPREPPRRVRRL